MMQWDGTHTWWEKEERLLTKKYKRKKFFMDWILPFGLFGLFIVGCITLLALCVD